jgi:hypothetical protein
MRLSVRYSRNDVLTPSRDMLRPCSCSTFFLAPVPYVWQIAVIPIRRTRLATSRQRRIPVCCLIPRWSASSSLPVELPRFIRPVRPILKCSTWGRRHDGYRSHGLSALQTRVAVMSVLEWRPPCLCVPVSRGALGTMMGIARNPRGAYQCSLAIKVGAVTRLANLHERSSLAGDAAQQVLTSMPERTGTHCLIVVVVEVVQRSLEAGRVRPVQ